MLTWDQTDKLNDISQDTTKTPEQRETDIREFMRIWAIEANTHYRPTEYELSHMRVHPTHSAPIDPYTQSSVSLALPGQIGHTYYPGA